MKKLMFTLVLMLNTFCIYSQEYEAESIIDEQIIRQVMQEQENAWNKGDAKEYVKSFMDEGIFTIITGSVFHNRSELEDRVASIFSTIFKDSQYTRKVKQIRFIDDNVALVELEVKITNYQGLPPGVNASEDKILRTSMLQALVKENNDWKVAAFHNVDVKVQ